ncbi:MAG TPA: heavy metal-associated domain-containing protein [Flavisolibacter sp.]|nr:heavy metal-associated domain-containing protein [Flavisolibacter sp.]
MEAQKFKTTINCAGCLAKVTPLLNGVAGEDNWEVDVKNPDKMLTVTADADVSEEAIIKAVNQAGFKAEAVG